MVHILHYCCCIAFAWACIFDQIYLRSSSFELHLDDIMSSTLYERILVCFVFHRNWGKITNSINPFINDMKTIMKIKHNVKSVIPWMANKKKGTSTTMFEHKLHKISVQTRWAWENGETTHTHPHTHTLPLRIHYALRTRIIIILTYVYVNMYVILYINLIFCLYIIN